MTPEQWTALATIVIAIFTVVLAFSGGVQAWLTRRAIIDSEKSSQRELRAYLSVVIGVAIFQDANLRFEAKPVIRNNGKTPAYNVRVRIKSEVLTESVAQAYIFNAPPDTPKSQSSIGPGEERIMSAVLPYRVQDSEVADIMTGNGKALWVWGTIHYDDVFMQPRFTEFCQRLSWLPDGSIYGIYDGRFGQSD